MVPVRAVGEALGAQVDWNSAKREVTLSLDQQQVSARVGSLLALRNSVQYSLDQPPLILGGRVFIPVRFFAEGLGAGVTWYGASREVSIHSKGYTPAQGEVWGYYYGTSSKAGLEEADAALSHVIIYSFEVNSAGDLEETTPYPEVQDIARSKGIAASIMVFQNNKQVLQSLLLNPASRTNMANQIINLVKERDYAGVNLDLENVPASAREGYVALVKTLSELLKPLNKTISLSVPAKESDSVSWVKGYDYAALGAFADRVTIMAYDEHWSGGEPGPVASVDWVKKVAGFAASQIPKEKILLGIGAYGYDWVAGGSGQAVTIQKAESVAASKGVQPAWDQNAAVPHYNYQDDSGKQHQVWYENRDSLIHKVLLARDLGLNGLAVWKLGFPPLEFWQDIIRIFKG